MAQNPFGEDMRRKPELDYDDQNIATEPPDEQDDEVCDFDDLVDEVDGEEEN